MHTPRHLTRLALAAALLGAGLAQAQEAEGPRFDADKLTEASATYAVTMALEDTTLRMTSNIAWQKARHEGKAVWQVTSGVDAMMGEYTETILLHPGDLRPLHQRVAQDAQEMVLDYTSGTVTGTATLPDGTENQISATLQAPIVGHVETAISALPLADGYATTLHSFETPTQNQRTWAVRVARTAEITTEAGTFDTFVVLVSDPGGGDQPASFWVTQAAPHRTIRSVSTLPSGLGGGTVLTELIELTEGGI